MVGGFRKIRAYTYKHNEGGYKWQTKCEGCKKLFSYRNFKGMKDKVRSYCKKCLKKV